jgi:pimeloyl-ACP methyl ester carboxylesterase
MAYQPLRALLLAALLAVPSATASPRQEAPSLRIEPYAFKLRDGSILAAERGTFSVPEDRSDPKSRRIDIGFIRFKSTNPNPGAPIVYLAGGPGGSGVFTAQGPRQHAFLELRKVADVIAFDQRGTGFSTHIQPCAAEKPLDPAKLLSEALLTAEFRATLARCIGQWKAQGVAIHGYTTAESAADVEDLRRALGVPKVSLWGISYGTHLGLEVMRRFPRSIDRVAFASIEGMSQTVKLPSNLDPVFARMDRLLDTLADVPPGHRGLVARMRRVHAKFDAEPQSITFKRKDGSPFTFRSDSFALRMFATFVPKNPGGIRDLAAGYAALEAGNTAPLAPLLHDFFYAEPVTLRGMPELMDLASGTTRARLAQVRSQAKTALAGTATNFPMPQIDGALPSIDLGDSFRREIRSNLPVLLLSGDLDIRTPLEEQAVAIAGLTRVHQVIVRNGGHDLFEVHPDIAEMLRRFFAGEAVTEKEYRLDPPKPLARQRPSRDEAKHRTGIGFVPARVQAARFRASS